VFTLALSLLALPSPVLARPSCQDAIDPAWTAPSTDLSTSRTDDGELAYDPELLASIEIDAEHELRFSEVGYGIILVEETAPGEGELLLDQVDTDGSVLDIWAQIAPDEAIPAALEDAERRAQEVGDALADVDPAECQAEADRPDDGDDTPAGSGSPLPPDDEPTPWCDAAAFAARNTLMPSVRLNYSGVYKYTRLDVHVIDSRLCVASGQVMHRTFVQPWWTWKSAAKRIISADQQDRQLIESPVVDFDGRILVSPLQDSTVVHLANGMW